MIPDAAAYLAQPSVGARSSRHAILRRLREEASRGPAAYVRPTDLTLSCGAAPRAGGQRSGTPVAATNNDSAGATCKRRDTARFGRKEGLQPRERRTARRQLQREVSRREFNK